jgi:flagellar protein FliO/FliZ
LFYLPAGYAETATEAAKSVPKTPATATLLQWSLGLLLVLCAFFLMVWIVRKFNGFSVNTAEQMRIVGGLSLGMRERIILLQVGKKQLVLGITPGRIEKLHVLEEEDCLLKPQTGAIDGGFGQQLMQAIKGKQDG